MSNIEDPRDFIEMQCRHILETKTFKFKGYNWAYCEKCGKKIPLNYKRRSL